MTMGFWLEQISKWTAVLFVVFSLRAFLFPTDLYIRMFTILNIIEAIADACMIFHILPLQAKYVPNNVVVLTELWILTFIFYKIIHSKVYRGLLIGIFIFCNSYLVTNIIMNSFLAFLPVIPQIGFFSVLIIGYFVYSVENFKFRKNSNLLRSFDFWMITGICFYAAATVIYMPALIYLQKLHAANLDYYFEIIANTYALVTNLLLIKAYMCLKAKHSFY